MIRICTCVHTDQDKLHGKNMRVMNPCKKGAFVRCTVCGKEYNVAKTDEKKEIK